MLCCYPMNIDVSQHPQASKLLKLIIMLAPAQVVFCVFTFFFDIMAGIHDLVGGIILLFIYCNKNWLACCCYVFYTMFDFTYSFILAGNVVMNIGKPTGSETFLLLMFLLKFPFFVISIYYVFLTYKELKALKIESSLSSEMALYTSAQPLNPPSSAPRQNLFQGRGQRVG